MNSTDKMICSTIDIIAKERIRTAGFNRTIVGIITAVEDTDQGIYSVSYQGETFKCYDIYPDRILDVNKSVHVLILNNDMSNDKFILGETRGD